VPNPPVHKIRRNSPIATGDFPKIRRVIGQYPRRGVLSWDNTPTIPLNGHAHSALLTGNTGANPVGSAKKVKKTFDASDVWYYQTHVNAYLNLRLLLGALLLSRAAVEV
jgi:hypothetical protein